MTRRRAKGDGSIIRRQDGRYQGALTIGYDQDGKQKRKTVYGKTKEEVRKKLENLRHQVSTTGIPTEDPLLRDFLERWLEAKARQVKPRTVDYYRYAVQKYINPKLGGTRLSKLTPLRIQSALGEIADEASPHTSNACRSTLRTALAQAVKWRLLSTNPSEAVDPVKAEKRDMTLWDPGQVEQFLEHAKSHRLYPLFYLAITSGLRIGELLALSWDDLKGNTLHVRHNLTKQNGQLTLATTKTTKGHRFVTIAADTLEVLKTHRQDQEAMKDLLGDAWEHPTHMFTTEIGTYLDHRNVLRVWHRLQDQAGVPRARLHDARHLHVSLLVRHGLDARTIADRVGHTNPAFTLRQYTHLFEEQRLAAAVPLDELLGDTQRD